MDQKPELERAPIDTPSAADGALAPDDSVLAPQGGQASLSGEAEADAEEKRKVRDYWISLTALSVLVGAAVIGIAIGHFKDVLDFSKQTWSFGIMTMGVIAIGFNLGHVHHKHKKVWAASDLLWISFAVLGLSGMLAPIESYVTANKIESSATLANVHYDGLVAKTGTAKRLACAAAADSAICAGWTKFESTVLSPGVTPNNIVQRVDSALLQAPKQAATGNRQDSDRD
jgi:type III secretory pathway component EscS